RSLEVAVQNYAPLTSIPLTSIGAVGPLVLLDIMLPTDQANPDWFGAVQMFVSSPSLAIYNSYLGQVELSHLPLAKWLTLPFVLPPDVVAKLSDGGYSDLTFTIALNVPYNENGHYLLDNLRFAADVTPVLFGIAVDKAGVTKAIFDYVTTAASTSIPYGPANALADQNGFIASPREVPPQTFVADPHAPFVGSLLGSQLTWTIGSHSVTATAQSTPLPTTTLPDGTHVVSLPDGRKVNIDSTPPAEPAVSSEPAVGAAFNGAIGAQLSVTPTGAAQYTVPIVIPPGVAGMAPALSLVYNSQSGNGIAGQGWDLGGQSMIYRCPRDAFHDGEARPVQMGAIEGVATDDGLCLDGQRLFLIADGTYRTEIDHNAVVTHSKDGTHERFKVVTKSGETRYYGFRSDSRVELPMIDADLGTKNVGAIWPMDRVVDTWGNYYDLHYNGDQADFTTRGLLLTEIDYTGHLANTGADPGSQGGAFTWVKFGYDFVDRPDVRRLRFGAASLPRNRRLTEITSPLGIYSLTYLPDEPTLPSRLQRIKYCSVAGNCMEPLEFDWEGGGYSWLPQPSAQAAFGQQNTYVLPIPLVKISGNEQRASGVAFADVDGDGKPDLLQAVSGSAEPFVEVSHVWRNTGHGWAQNDNWALPGPLANKDGTRAKGFLVDMDGDGLPDFVREGRFLCDHPESDNTCTRAMLVAFNRLKTQGTWVDEADEHGPTAIFGQSFFDQGGQSLDFKSGQAMIDVNGDGLTDFVNFGNDSTNFPALKVLLNKGPTVGFVTTNDYGGTEGVIQDYHFVDVNRDGLPDLVKPIPFNQGGGSRIYLNTGKLNAQGNVWRLFITLCPIGTTDVDGDGMFDGSTAKNLGGGVLDTTQFFSTGTGCTPDGGEPYGDAIDNLVNEFPGTGFLPSRTLVDFNADGLADLLAIPTQAAGGGGAPVDTSVHFHINTGTTWTLQTQYATVPVFPINGGSVTRPALDLNGDGVTDLLSSGAPGGPFDGEQKAWLNTFKPPIIKKFPSGLARKTEVAYVSITGADDQVGNTYSDPNAVAAGTVAFVTPMRVVKSVTADDALGGTGTATTTYRYESMRASKQSHLPQGFMKVITTDPARITTVSTFAQAYPYTGLLRSVTRYASISTSSDPNGTDRVLVAFATTETQYCDRVVDSFLPPACASNDTPNVYPSNTPLFLYPIHVKDTSRLLTDSTHDFSDEFIDKQITETDYRYDKFGNPLRTTTTIHNEYDVLKSDAVPETYTKETINSYGDPGSLQQQQGKATVVIVNSQRIAPVDGNNLSIGHHTTFEYQPVSFVQGLDGASITALALTKKQEEPNTGSPTEQHTAYAYDRFGNVRVTTVCGSDFTNCAVGAAGPADSPYRTSRVSYDPNDYPLPRGPGLVTSLGYNIGRFPVKRTNPMGHVEYSAYDPVKGGLLQKTDPNGLSVCYQYDDFGRLTAETARCGSDGPITTTTEYFLTSTADPANTKMVTVTRPATGATSWTYVDGLSRLVRELGRSFDGGLVETTTTFDNAGRVAFASKPHPAGVNPANTITTYDDLSRPKIVLQQLGNLGSFGGSVTKRVDIS
ncbi:MAG TPA: toxin TcdB middle/N-terminal domain-containing protein, partial [Polyangia bacterium]|nr:toxin TcdB middle/N-terminal domain-containing protein [Polyangia bacterium]